MQLIDLVGVIGYALAAVLFFFLALLLSTSWRGRMQGGLLVVSAFTTAVWAGVIACHAAGYAVPLSLIWALEALRDLSWLLFMGRLLEWQLTAKPSDRLWLQRIRWLFAAVAAVLILPFEAWFADSFVLQQMDFSALRLILELSLAVVGLIVVEQVYRNTPWEHRWGIKYLCLGVGGLFAFDFFFFADALLFRRIDPSLWLARGGASAFSVPLIAVAVARNPQWSFDLFVSRKVVFHTTTLVAAGAYLLLMSLVGYYIRFYGGEWGALLQTIFFVGAGLVLVVLLFSGQFRSRVKVFVSKHFFSYRYDYREEWLHLISVLSGKVLQASLAERVIYALCEIVDSPGGVLWLCADRDGCAHESCWNLSSALIDTEASFEALCLFFRRNGLVIDLDEYSRDPNSNENVEIPDWMFARARLWLLVPLFHEERLLGFCGLAHPRTPQRINWETMDLLMTAARQAASYLALDRAAKALADAKQFEGFNRLSAFIVHDLKNLVAQLSLVATNGERHRDNPEFVADALDTVGNSVRKMNHLLAQLRGGMSVSKFNRVSLRETVDDVARERAVQKPQPTVEMPELEDCIVFADRDRFAAVLGHVVQNAQEATPPSGSVAISAYCDGGEAIVSVTDNGTGMDEAFVRDRLFKPFDSTKGLAGMGIGAYECREFLRALGGRIQVHSELGKGTKFTMIFPVEGNREAVSGERLMVE